MSENERLVTELVERWAAAISGGDLETVLADHTDDIVMFDVPPPHDGVRGAAAYREVWPDFLAWQTSGGTFDLVELAVTAGDRVAFAHALLRCDTPEGLAEFPDRRLRLTLGLRKEDGRWAIAHEHHSFCTEG
ncbi:YybH family protein [Nocardiopsis protaetiae]|uniref:YybH family protein n=1 Tax=Nocardiopsis protaetiae TaxID=3382270 RepID=UPI00387B2C1F